jgi:DegV family protein with EDD domain
MSDYILSCSSTSDLSVEQVKRRNISYIPYHYYIDGKEYSDDLFQSMSAEQFYGALKSGADTKTAQVNIEEYSEYFTKLLEKGKDVIHVTLSSGLTGSYRSAINAAEAVREKFPDRKLYIVDSLGASSGYGLIIETLADLRDKGYSIDALREWTEAHKLEMHHWFFSTDLTFYVKGGRITKTQGMLGGMLGICPLLNMDEAGKLVPREKIRTKKKVIREIVSRMEANAEGNLDYSGKCFISNSGCPEDAREVADLVESLFPKLNGKVVINSIGPTIGSHTGPGTVALFFWGGSRAGT